VTGRGTSLKGQAQHLAERAAAVDQEQDGAMALPEPARAPAQLFLAEGGLSACAGVS
jgi:hypothetical protein